LCLALHGNAAEILLDLNEHSDTAYADIWAAIRIRFGGMDDERDCMIRFDNRRQADTETLPEYAQTLCTLHRQAWPKAAAAERDSTLKQRFEDGVNSPELSQFLRLHTCTDSFEQTVKKARQFAETVDLQKNLFVLRNLALKLRTAKDLPLLLSKLNFSQFCKNFAKCCYKIGNIIPLCEI